MNCTAAIFLRADIFNKVLEFAREPDKIVVTRLIWDDPEMLSGVVERRFLSAHPNANSGSDLWLKYFPESVNERPSKDYILSRILPRPRDIVYLVKSAISNAVNRGHGNVEAKDITDAEYIYSKYAMDSILVENSISVPQLERVLYEFAGLSSIVSQNDINRILEKTKIETSKHPTVLEHLIWLSFLGLEIKSGEFVFSDDPHEYKKNFVLAQRVSETAGHKRFQIHPAFRSYLEIQET